MSENDDYDRKRTASKKPVTVLLTLLLIAGVAAAIYETSDRARPTTTSTPTPANPNILVPPGSGGQSTTPP